MNPSIFPENGHTLDLKYARASELSRTVDVMGGDQLKSIELDIPQKDFIMMKEESICKANHAGIS